jgi:hypothetical protein
VGSMAPRALDVAGSRRTMKLWARGRHGSAASWAREQHGVYNIVGSGRMTLLQDREWCHGHGDGACVVDIITGLGRGRWRRVRASTVVGNAGTESPGRTQQWCEGSDEGTGCGEVDDNAGSREIFGRIFWQLDDVSESLRGY